MNKTSYLNFLKTIHLFSGVSDEAIYSLLSSEETYIDTFGPDDMIFAPEKQKKQKYLGILLSGAATAHSVDSTSGVLLRTFAKGDCVGLATLFSTRYRFVSMILSKGNSRVLFISENDIRKLIEIDPVFSMNFVRTLSEKICFLNTKISCFTAGSPERKLAFFLCSQCSEANPTINISANSLSDMLNIGRASLYRVFDKFTFDGFIRKDGKTITVINRKAMIELYK